MDTFTLRVPSDWAARLNSHTVRAWLLDWLHHPVPLQFDPGPGDARISVRLPRGPAYMLADLHREPVTVALRRLAASRIGALSPAVEVSPTTASAPLARSLMQAKAPMLAGRAQLQDGFRNDLALTITQQRERARHGGYLPPRRAAGVPELRSSARPWKALLLFVVSLGALLLLGVVLAKFLGGSGPAVPSGPSFSEW